MPGGEWLRRQWVFALETGAMQCPEEDSGLVGPDGRLSDGGWAHTEVPNYPNYGPAANRTTSFSPYLLHVSPSCLTSVVAHEALHVAIDSLPGRLLRTNDWSYDDFFDVYLGEDNTSDVGHDIDHGLVPQPPAGYHPPQRVLDHNDEGFDRENWVSWATAECISGGC